MFFHAPVFNGDIQAKLNPEAMVVILAEDKSSKKSGAVFNLLGESSWSKNWSTILGRGQCSLYSQGADHPKPFFMRADPERSFDCLLREGYAEGAFDEVTITLGKRTLDFSQSVLTSPSNPASAGLTLSSPLGPLEGVWGTQVKWVPNERHSFLFGTAVGERAGNYRLHPFARWKWSGDTVDFSAFGANRFGAGGITWQATDKWLLYTEANAHLPKAQNWAGENFASDALVGNSWSPDFTPLTLTTEYFRNGHGLAGSASASRLGMAAGRLRLARDDYYDFAQLSSQDPPFWGISDFLSRDIFFLHLRPSVDRQWGPLLTAVWSLNDYSLYTIVGYTFFSAPTDKEFPWQLQVEWRSFYGAEDSEFGQAARFQGEHRFLLTWTLLN